MSNLRTTLAEIADRYENHLRQSSHESEEVQSLKTKLIKDLLNLPTTITVADIDRQLTIIREIKFNASTTWAMQRLQDLLATTPNSPSSSEASTATATVQRSFYQSLIGFLKKIQTLFSSESERNHHFHGTLALAEAELRSARSAVEHYARAYDAHLSKPAARFDYTPQQIAATTALNIRADDTNVASVLADFDGVATIQGQKANYHLEGTVENQIADLAIPGATAEQNAYLEAARQYIRSTRLQTFSHAAHLELLNMLVVNPSFKPTGENKRELDWSVRDGKVVCRVKSDYLAVSDLSNPAEASFKKLNANGQLTPVDDTQVGTTHLQDDQTLPVLSVELEVTLESDGIGGVRPQVTHYAASSYSPEITLTPTPKLIDFVAENDRTPRTLGSFLKGKIQLGDSRFAGDPDAEDAELEAQLDQYVSEFTQATTATDSTPALPASPAMAKLLGSNAISQYTDPSEQMLLATLQAGGTSVNKLLRDNESVTITREGSKYIALVHYDVVAAQKVKNEVTDLGPMQTVAGWYSHEAGSNTSTFKPGADADITTMASSSVKTERLPAMMTVNMAIEFTDTGDGITHKITAFTVKNHCSDLTLDKLPAITGGPVDMEIDQPMADAASAQTAESGSSGHAFRRFDFDAEPAADEGEGIADMEIDEDASADDRASRLRH